MKSINVVAAIIELDGRVLCVQRAVNKRAYISEKWEFPGGKIEEGETEHQAIVREIQEELRLDITVDEKLLTVDHTYPDFHLVMDCFRCHPHGEGIPDVTLTEHINSCWLSVDSDQFRCLDWAAADLPVVDVLRSRGR